MNAKRVTAFSILMLIVMACFGVAQNVRYNYDKTADFSKYKTYAWVTVPGAAKVNDILENDIKSAVNSQLEKKGLTQAEPDKADLLLGMQPAVNQEQQLTTYSTGWGYGPGWYGGGWYGPGGSTVTGQTSTIYVGQLTLDFYDSAKHDLVWRGVVSKTIDPNAKPEKQQKNLDKAVAKLLKNFPPPQKKS